MAEKSPQELIQIDLDPPRKKWMDPSVDFENGRGTWSYPGGVKSIEYMGFANPREWSPTDEDWKLPENWQQIIHDGFKERLSKYRSLQVFMDTCVRCGACADKCHFFIGSGDPKNMPVLRSELLRSIYRNDFTLAGKILGAFAGGRKLTEEVEQLPPHHGDFCRIDTKRAEHRAPAALTTLVEVIEPLLDDFWSQFSGARKTSEQLASGREILPVYGPQQLCAENGHVLGIAGAEEVMALVGASPTSDTDIHEDPE